MLNLLLFLVHKFTTRGYMKKIIFALLITLVAVTQVMAASVTKNLTINWTFDATQESTISGFKVYNQDGTVVMDNIPANLRTKTSTYTFDDTKPQAFHLIAYDLSGKQTTPSNIGIWTPAYKSLIGVGKITIEMN